MERRIVKKKLPPVVKFLRSLPKWVYGLAAACFVLPIVVFGLVSARSAPAPRVPISVQPAPPLPADTRFGHFPYSEAPLSELTTIAVAGDGYEFRLRKAAALGLERLQRDARSQGIEFVVISAFRSKAEQEHLFYEIARQRNQTPEERARVSAPPGYSEHHTGYAVDVGDANEPGADLSPTFAQTNAYQWLLKNATNYGFELSFPANNFQGVMYEPWHWRFVGDADSLRVFSRGRRHSYL